MKLKKMNDSSSSSRPFLVLFFLVMLYLIINYYILAIKELVDS